MRAFLPAVLAGCVAGLEICPSADAGIYYILGAEDEEEFDVLEELGLSPSLPKPVPGVDEEEGPLPPERPKRRRFVLRVGALVTTSGEDEWNTGYAGELAYSGRKWEAGVEVSQVESSAGDVRSLLITARAGYLLRAANGLHACLSAGAVAEQGELLTAGEKGSVLAGVLTVGAGYGRLDGAWEMRVSYNILLGDTNATGSVVAGAGVRF